MGQNGERWTLVEQLRAAFASGRAAEGEQLLIAALDAGVPWDVASRAVAEGMAKRYGSAGAPLDGRAESDLVA